MKAREFICSVTYAEYRIGGLRQRQARPAGSVPVVTPAEISVLGDALAAGHLPCDFEAKLGALAQGDILHQSVARNCGRFISLLDAERQGLFTGLTTDQRNRILAVLAYVRRDDDLVPDYKPGGYVDDQEQVRAAVAELGPLLDRFNAWRLRHQVPALWTPSPSTLHIPQLAAR